MSRRKGRHRLPAPARASAKAPAAAPSTTSLTTKQRRFVEEYCAEPNAAAAARRAGYSEKTAKEIGHRNLGKPHILAAIEERMDRYSMSAAEAQYRLTQWGRGSVEPFLQIDSSGRVRIALETEEAQKHLHLIKKLKQKERFIAGREDEPDQIERTLEIELHDAKDAVKEIARIRCLTPDGSASPAPLNIVLVREAD